MWFGSWHMVLNHGLCCVDHILTDRCGDIIFQSFLFDEEDKFQTIWGSKMAVCVGGSDCVNGAFRTRQCCCCFREHFFQPVVLYSGWRCFRGWSGSGRKEVEQKDPADAPRSSGMPWQSPESPFPESSPREPGVTVLWECFQACIALKYFNHMHELSSQESPGKHLGTWPCSPWRADLGCWARDREFLRAFVLSMSLEQVNVLSQAEGRVSVTSALAVETRVRLEQTELPTQ